MKFETIRVDKKPPLGRITLNRPDRLNALSRQVLEEVEAAARLLDRVSDMRVVILSGAGRAFTSGADLNDSNIGKARADTESPWLDRRAAGLVGLRTAEALESMGPITIAQLHGYVIGGGVVLTSACDLRVAAEDTIFSIPEVDLGIPLTWGGIPRLVRDIGPAMTKELVMTCRRFDATEAKAIGFINRVVEPGELESHVDALATELITKPPVPVAMTKAQVNGVTRTMIGDTAHSDGDLLLGAAADPASQQAAQDYLRHLKRK